MHYMHAFVILFSIPWVQSRQILTVAIHCGINQPYYFPASPLLEPNRHRERLRNRRRDTDLLHHWNAWLGTARGLEEFWVLLVANVNRPQIYKSGIFHDFTSLRSKHSRTNRTKFGQRENILVFHIRDAWKVGREQKGWSKGVGEGKEGNACPQTPQFWKTRSPTNGAPDWCGVVILIDKCISSLKWFQ